MNRLGLSLLTIVACWALMSSPCWGIGPNRAPMEVRVTNVDTVGLGTLSTVSISVWCWPRQVKNITARIVLDSGFEIVSQPQEKYAETDTGAVFFKGVIRATARGIWRVRVEAEGDRPDSIRFTNDSDFYIQISDTLNRAMTSAEYILLQSPFGKTIQNPRPDKVIRSGSGPVAKPGRHGSVGDTCSTIPKAAKVIDTTRSKKAKPAPADSSTKKDSATKRISGTFNVTGYLSYHDPRDPQGWLKPARNVDVEVWNDGLYDTPPSADVLLATGITDWYGCFSFWWLDNSDGDGTADPIIPPPMITIS